MEQKLNELREREYATRLETIALRREVFGSPPLAADSRLAGALLEREAELTRLEGLRARAEAAARRTADPRELRGAASTGLSAAVAVHLPYLPTSIYHLLDRAEQPLLTCTLTRHGTSRVRRVRVTSHLEGYSARAVDTVELDSPRPVRVSHLPTLFADRVASVRELSAATLNVLVEDLEGQVELHRTEPVRLLARTSAPMRMTDPDTGERRDLTRYLGAFVTPNAPEVLSFLRVAADGAPDGRLIGYQLPRSAVAGQVRAIFGALKDADVTYVNSVVAFSPEDGATHQRVRLPRESIVDRQANCLDGTVLMASLLEAASLSPALVLVPGHAFLAWETWRGSDDWRYLETTMIGSGSFEDACAVGEARAEQYQALARKTADPAQFRRWSLRDLRLRHRVTPME